MISGSTLGSTGELSQLIAMDLDQCLLVVENALEEAIALAHAHPNLSLCIRLTLVKDKPVLPLEKVPALVSSNGHFRGSLGMFLAKWLIEQSKLKEVEWEFSAQIEEALEGE
jgi:predicted glycoside hydrolase/deacetylase ChbG (UPF0249 family)